ncbi:MFS transporter [Streptomyces sp. MAR4 CNX-425]|uniref:MFS transporter n=1 Tax=Streptomyces sp. MAR4 CNX-425 TaxID=3406343 RepID=UPI003B50F6AD
MLRTPGARSFVLPGFAARQPFAMLTMSIVLLVRHTSGSYALAGAVAATAGVAMALCAPLSGKLADRHGQPAVLLPSVLLHAASVALLSTLALAGAPGWALVAAAVPTGASIPQVGPMVRARWSHLLAAGPDPRTPLQHTATAFESVTDEFTFVVGPVLAAALCTGVHPAAGLAAEGALTLAGGLLFAAQRRTAPPAERPRGRGGRTGGEGREGLPRGRRASALRAPALPVLVAAFFGVGAVFGGMQVSLTAFSESIGRPGLSGILYGVFAAGNMLAGVAIGMVHWRGPAQRRLLVAYPLLVATASGLWAVAGLESAVALAGLGLAVGVCIAPAVITGFTLADALVPKEVRTEAFTWLTGAVALGQAAASTAAGRLADGPGASAGFLVPLAATALACATLLLLRQRLRPAESHGMITVRGGGRPVPASVD